MKTDDDKIPPVCGDRGSGSCRRGGRRCSRPKMASLLISVLDRKLDPIVEPLLCTLVRLCVDPIYPIRNVADNDNDHDDGNESGGERNRSSSSSS